MASVTGRAAGFIATLYYSSAVDAVKDVASMATTAAAGNEVLDVADIGSLNKTRTVIDIQYMVMTLRVNCRAKLIRVRSTSTLRLTWTTLFTLACVMTMA